MKILLNENINQYSAEEAMRQSIIKGSGIITSTSFNRIWLLPCSYQVGRSAHLIGVRYEFDMNKVAMKTGNGTT